MAEKSSSSGAKGSDASFRRTWDTKQYAEKAKEIDRQAYEHAKETEKALQSGKKPPRIKLGADLPKPTKALEARTKDLEIDKNLNKTVLVSTTTGKGKPGFYCELCSRTLKDSVAYLDHVNGRSHLARLGQTTQVIRATLSDVRARIELLRSQQKNKVTSQNFDFEKRLQVIKEQEEAARQARRENKKRKREEAKSGPDPKRREEEIKAAAAAATTAGGAFGNVLAEERKRQEEEDQMASMMGFGGFGGPKKR